MARTIYQVQYFGLTDGRGEGRPSRYFETEALAIHAEIEYVGKHGTGYTRVISLVLEGEDDVSTN